MNRRGFLKGALAGLAANIFVPRATDAFKWKRRASGIWVVNPEWVKAPYEIHYYYLPENKSVVPFVTVLAANAPTYRPRPGEVLIPENYPVRLNSRREMVPVMIEMNT
jgi:hypothetical protein